jgi:hypothetical protein
MTRPSIELIAEAVVFYSEPDEESFFIRLRNIPEVRDVRGEGRAIIVVCDQPPMADNSLRELSAIFFRYGVDMRQLDAFLTDENRHWFADNASYWKNVRRQMAET